MKTDDDLDRACVDAPEALKRRQFLWSLGKWSPVVMTSVLGIGAMATNLARAVNWNDCPTDGAWLNGSGSGGHWINSSDQGTHLQGGNSGENRPPPRRPRASNPWLNGNRDGWTNRQGCRGGTWVNY
ncbi:MAG: hypothetical protein H6974_06815 [Gammaproteobacteria bacterium]|nr:hypothetical protein [Gammaproteobacteria bacterium]MCP5196483.1 hypothetical protein [Gammaproteobacteria bacterium]